MRKDEIEKMIMMFVESYDNPIPDSKIGGTFMGKFGVWSWEIKFKGAKE